MVDKSINRSRVARWRAKRVTEGYKSLSVCLSPGTLEMIKSLHRHFRTRRKTAKLIEMAIRTLYEKTRPENN